jgi:hypothetical protein
MGGSIKRQCKTGRNSAKIVRHGLAICITCILSVHGPPRLYFEPLKLLNFDFYADTDPDVHFNGDPDPVSKKMWIRIRNPGSVLTPGREEYYVGHTLLFPDERDAPPT